MGSGKKRRTPVKLLKTIKRSRSGRGGARAKSMSAEASPGCKKSVRPERADRQKVRGRQTNTPKKETTSRGEQCAGHSVLHSSHWEVKRNAPTKKQLLTKGKTVSEAGGGAEALGSSRGDGRLGSSGPVKDNSSAEKKGELAGGVRTQPPTFKKGG